MVCKPPARWVATFRRRSAKPDGACVTKSQLMKSKAAPAKKPEVAPPKAAKAGEGQSLDLCDDPVFCPDTSDGDSASWTKLITEQDQLQEAEEQGGGALTSKDLADFVESEKESTSLLENEHMVEVSLLQGQVHAVLHAENETKSTVLPSPATHAIWTPLPFQRLFSPLGLIRSCLLFSAVAGVFYRFRTLRT